MELNDPQLKAVKTLNGALLIIAGAGSGKTRVISHRIAHMLEKGINQSSILALTFTNKAAREMKNRIKELTGRKLNSLTACTFHAFGVKILRDEIEILGYRSNFSIYDTTDKIDSIKESLRECKLYGEKTDLLKIEQIFSNIKTGRYTWEDVDTTLMPAYEAYNSNLKIYNALDFDDLLTLPIKIFKEYPEILSKYQKRYSHILVDEFQDTSLIQYELLRILSNPEGRKSNICVVGDDDQSIYSWRGANYRNMLLFERDFPQALEIKLEQNYRSTSTILEAANGLIAHNTNRKGKNLWSGKGEGRPIELRHPVDEAEEAAFIADTISKLRFTENRSYDDFGVLVRTNNQFDCIEEAFLAKNIPYRVSGGQSFFDRKEIRDILSYLRVIANSNDDINLLRIINTPRRGIGKAGILSASQYAGKNKTSIYDAFYQLNFIKTSGQKSEENLLFSLPAAKNAGSTDKKSGRGIEEFLSLIEESREEFLSGGSLSAKLKTLIDRIDYWSYLVTEFSKNEKMAKWKFSNIQYLIKMMEDWEKDPDNLDNGLYAYLNRISLLTRSDGEDDNEKSVNLMTIHASKGLEFPVVFIAGAEDGFLPHEKSIDEESEGEGIEEERRLFYVAITRARDKLYLTSCKKRRRRDSIIERLPSPFLPEIPAYLLEIKDDINEDDPDAAKASLERMLLKLESD